MTAIVPPRPSTAPAPGPALDPVLATLARRAVATGVRGAVAAGHPTAAAIGLAALARGGNAYDAALAAALAETVLMPPKCGPAGDLVALTVRAGEAPRSLLAIGGAAAGLADTPAARGEAPAPVTGPLSVGVPGAPAGYAALAEHARFPLSDLVAPAVGLARAGVAWTDRVAALAADSDALLRRHQPDGCVFRPAAAPHRAGDVVRLPGLADVLERLGTDGAALFHGSLGERVAAHVRHHGGVLTAADLTAVEVLERPADRLDTARGSVWTTGAPTHGPALAAALRAHRGAGSIAPAEVAAAVRALRAGPGGTDGGTSTVAAADADGTAVVVVHSNSFPRFGSGLVVPGLDLVLSNRAGRGFTWRPGHPNAPEPGRRPRTTLHAWGLRPTGGALVLGATPGGEQQVVWNAQLLDLLLDSGTSPASLGRSMVADRWDSAGGTPRVEGDTLPRLGLTSSHTLVRVGADTVSAVADPRGDATAVAL